MVEIEGLTVIQLKFSNFSLVNCIARFNLDDVET